jgi:hypothetical protein
MALMDAAKPTKILKRDALGRVTLPREQREALLDEFERSGLPASRFACAAGINYQTFACWVQQRRHQRGEYAQRPAATSAALRLVEVVAEAMPGGMRVEETCPPAPCPVLELRLPCGARLLLHDSRQAELAAHLLRHLQHSTITAAVSC